MSTTTDADFTERDFIAAASDLGGLFRAGGTLGNGLGITDDEQEAVYQLGHGLYGQGRYAEAFRAFSLLVVHNHLEPRFLMALAGAAQMLGRHHDALQHYATATLIRLDDPLAPLHSAECLIALGRLAEATESLELAITLAGDGHPAVRMRAESLLHPLRAPVH